MRIASIAVAALLAAALPVGTTARPAGSSTERTQGAAAPDASSPGPQGPQAPANGRSFGEHVSGMAPEHPKDHGRMFGECVSEMAITGSCPHHDEM